MWCVVITMTTVGYGDVYAVSPFGRAISIINALWGAFVISMLVASIGQVFDLNDNQKKAIVQITNRKKAAYSLKASLKYFIAKKEYQRKIEKDQKIANGQYNYYNEEEEDQDYVVSKQELSELKDQMVKSADLMKEERAQNEELLPVDVEGHNIEIVKEQIIDLNDKFDFLVKLMLKNQTLAAEQVENEVSGETETEFKMLENLSSANTNSTSLNGNAASSNLYGMSETELLQFVRKFEYQARKTAGAERQQYRKAEPQRPLSERVQEAIRYYENLHNKKK